jgi:hypothetical protein
LRPASGVLDHFINSSARASVRPNPPALRREHAKSMTQKRFRAMASFITKRKRRTGPLIA